MQIVREVEGQGLSFEQVRRKYGIRGHGTVQGWVRRYGNGSRGKVIRVETPEEMDELKRLKARVRALETALAGSNVELAIERAYLRMACERAGIKDVEEFKKKADGPRGTGR